MPDWQMHFCSGCQLSLLSTYCEDMKICCCQHVFEHFNQDRLIANARLMCSQLGYISQLIVKLLHIAHRLIEWGTKTKTHAAWCFCFLWIEYCLGNTCREHMLVRIQSQSHLICAAVPINKRQQHTRLTWLLSEFWDVLRKCWFVGLTLYTAHIFYCRSTSILNVFATYCATDFWFQKSSPCG